MFECTFYQLDEMRYEKEGLRLVIVLVLKDEINRKLEASVLQSERVALKEAKWRNRSKKEDQPKKM